MKSVSWILLVLTSIIMDADSLSQTEIMAPNRLINATSPYLLQHADNPVDWYEWGSDALAKAKTEGKPILVSIGYSSCHWCHVMEHESFENEKIAKLMNDNFVCIKVDREERPDIDQIYMEAVQAMGINGGWPLNVFITPEQKPFYGGTYFPPDNWSQLLKQIANLYHTKREEIASNADQLANHIAKSDLDRFRTDPEKAGFRGENLSAIYQSLVANFDHEWGGIDRAPKFVMPSQWDYILRYYNSSSESQPLERVVFTLKKIAMGGIYDQVGGGFARYSVDGRWFAPHFEKMLYDNAQLLSLYSNAYKITKDDIFKTVVTETVAWLEREMMHPQGGFYSALDADSEGEEGKFYVWTKSELDSLLPEKLAWVKDYYSVTDSGNWEHGNNILFVQSTKEDAIKNNDLSSEEFREGLARAKQLLLEARRSRVRPGLDDKILTGWNAMMTIGLLDAHNAVGDEHYLQLAKQNMSFVEERLKEEDKLFRSWKGKHAATEGFLEDYAFVIAAYIKLYQVTFDERWIREAEKTTEYVIDHFFDKEENFFHYASSESEKLIARKKEVFDNVIPSSNAVMARNLYHLGIILDSQRYKKIATEMTLSLSDVILKEPGYASYWASNYSEMTRDMAEVVVVGKDAVKVSLDLQRHYHPDALYMGTTTSSNLPLIKDKSASGDRSTIFVCFNKTCKLPVQSIEKALDQIASTR